MILVSHSGITMKKPIRLRLKLLRNQISNWWHFTKKINKIKFNDSIGILKETNNSS